MPKAKMEVRKDVNAKGETIRLHLTRLEQYDRSLLDWMLNAAERHIGSHEELDAHDVDTLAVIRQLRGKVNY